VCVCVYIHLLCIKYIVPGGFNDSTLRILPFLNGNWYCLYLCFCAFMRKERGPGLLKYENMFHKLELSSDLQ
jgi:hypothetical protein